MFRRLTWQAHASEIFSIAVTSSQVVTASGDPSIKIWDTRSQEHPLIYTFAKAHPLGAHHVTVDVDNGGSTAASSGFGQEVVIWDLLQGKEKSRITPNGIHPPSVIVTHSSKWEYSCRQYAISWISLTDSRRFIRETTKHDRRGMGFIFVPWRENTEHYYVWWESGSMGHLVSKESRRDRYERFLRNEYSMCITLHSLMSEVY